MVSISLSTISAYDDFSKTQCSSPSPRMTRLAHAPHAHDAPETRPERFDIDDSGFVDYDELNAGLRRFDMRPLSMGDFEVLTENGALLARLTRLKQK